MPFLYKTWISSYPHTSKRWEGSACPRGASHARLAKRCHSRHFPYPLLCLLTLCHPVSKIICTQMNFGLPKAFLVGAQAVAKPLSAPPPGLHAGRVFSCHMALLLRRSDIEVSGCLCLSYTNLGDLYSGHLHQTLAVVQLVQVTQGLRSHAILNTSHTHGCV